MRYSFGIIISCLIMFLAWAYVRDKSIDIGDGLILEITPQQYQTVTDNTRCVQLLNAIERGEITPATEPKAETLIVQEGSLSVRVTPIKYKNDGSVKTAAKAALIRYPEVSKKVLHPIFETPSKDKQSKPQLICKPSTRRIISTPASYKIKDELGATVKSFETAKALAEYINSK